MFDPRLCKEPVPLRHVQGLPLSHGPRPYSEDQPLQKQLLQDGAALVKRCQQLPSEIYPAGEAGSTSVPSIPQTAPWVSGELSHTPQAQNQVTHLLNSYCTYVHTGKAVQNWIRQHFHCEFHSNTWKRKGNRALKPFLCPQSPLSG